MYVLQMEDKKKILCKAKFKMLQPSPPVCDTEGVHT